MHKKAQFATLHIIVVALIIVLIIFIAFALLILGQIMSRTITANDRAERSDAALYSMLDSNQCTPFTNLPFSEVLAIGIGEGKKMDSDTILINYRNLIDTVRVVDCLPVLRGQAIPEGPSLFYVEYSSCPGMYHRCFVNKFTPTGTAAVPLNVKSMEYLSLPNGDVAKVVLETPDRYRTNA